MTRLPARRLLLVHAHPDDESIGNGATMAKYAAEGALVTLVTCTLGEEGEVIPPALAHLAPERDDTLGPYREGELAAAMRALGVSDHRFLGGAGRYRDSGMMGVPGNDRPGSLWRTSVDEAAPHLMAVIREVRPQVLITYGPDGGYGHPDHIRAHQIAMRARELAADPGHRPDLGAPHTVAKAYWSCVPERYMRNLLTGPPPEYGPQPFGKSARLADIPGVVPDDEVTTAIDGARYVGRKAAAMAEHATQITVRGRWFALSNGLGQPLPEREFYRLVDGEVAGASAEDDLFAGLGV